MATIRMLVLGTGGMARNHAAEFRKDPRVEVVAACDVLPGRARDFAAAHHIPHHFTDLDEALRWNGFDACTNVTPDAIHHPTTLKLVTAGKHVLCEKPLAESFALADEMAVAADRAGVVNMVNLTYRNVAALHKARSLIAAGEIGEVRHLEASYRQSWLVGNHWGDWSTDPKWLWRLSEKHGSRGVLGDVGIHILDFAAHAVDMMPVEVTARLHTFDKAAGGRIGDYVLDANDSAVMTTAFGNGALGVIHCSRYMTGYDNVLKLDVFGTRGAIELVHAPGWTEIRCCSGADVHTLAWRPLIPESVETIYRRFVTAIVTGPKDGPDFRRGADLQKVLDECFRQGRRSASAG
jgi:predicted dehydrogenase